MSTKLNSNQLLAVSLIASGSRGCDISKELKVTEETISRWRQQPEFRAAVNSMLAETQTATMDRLRGLAGKALGVIEIALDDTELAAGERLKAAFRILELCGAKEAAKHPGETDPAKLRKTDKEIRDFDAMMAI